MTLDLSDYQTILFDCDGVILDSNEIKTEAFFESVKSYGEEEANELADYNAKFGGITRKQKFEYFFENILGREPKEDEFQDLMMRFSEYVKRGLEDCDFSEGIFQLKRKLPKCKWFIVSGGDADEIRHSFRSKGLIELFDGIYGGPESKQEIFQMMKKKNLLVSPSIYIGDSEFDHNSAKISGIDFLFVSGWSEFIDWRSYCSSNGIESVPSIDVLAEEI